MNRRRWLAYATLAAAGTLWGGSPASARARAGGVRARVLILGGGFAGGACALRLLRLEPRLDVTQIDPDSRYVTCPMSDAVIAGERALASITVSRQGLRRAGVRIIGERAVHIDGPGRRLQLASGTSVPFDRLVAAPGIRFLWNRIEGYDEEASRRMPHAWNAGAQTERLAGQLRAMADGGTVAISVPAGPMRCPPGPYERASLIAHYLQRHKPRSKVLILDANNSFPKQPQFTDAWQRLYAGMIEWIPVTQGGAVVRVDTATMSLFTDSGAHRVDVANVIPPQAPGAIAPASGLASDHGWCPIDPRTFESINVPGVHVIGDACIADAMPKSASAAVSQAQRCAEAIVSLLWQRALPAPAFDSVCYSLVAPSMALSFPGHFTVTDGRIGTTGPEPAGDTVLEPAQARQVARAAAGWYREIRRAAFAG